MTGQFKAIYFRTPPVKIPPMTRLWCNGRWLDPGEFPASAMDRGGILGLGLFETILAAEGRPVFAERHLARLAGGCARLGWALPDFDFTGIATRLLARENLVSGFARIRLSLSAGSGELRNIDSGADRLLWMAAFPMAAAAAPLLVNLSPWPRNERSPLAGMKCASYAENLIALDRARRLGYGETLFFNTAGNLCEAATSNVFLIRGGKLLTPDLSSGCLPGVTRAVILEIARKAGIPCEECPLDAADLESADEIFLTSATRGPESVDRCCERTFAPGNFTAQLRKAWLGALVEG